MKGTVVRFYRSRGFGFIKPAEGGKNVLVHWSNLVTDDKWPYVKRGTEVEFELVEKDDNGKRSAKEVTLVGGEKIPVFTPDNSDRVMNDDDVYSGTIKFYDFRKGFGVIKPDEEITWNDVTTEDGVFFRRDAIVSTGAAKGMVLNLRRGKKVTFKVHTDKKGLGAHELQNEDGNPLEYEPRKPRTGGQKRKRSTKKGSKKPTKKRKVAVVRKTKEELIEERNVDEEENLYTGIVKSYNKEKDFGFITIDEDITYDGVTAKDKIYVMKEDIVCSSDEIGLNVDSKVIFKIYKDSKGLGACEVQNEDGSPIVFESEESPKSDVEEPEKEQSPEIKPVKAKKKSTKKATKKTKKRTKKN